MEFSAPEPGKRREPKLGILAGSGELPMVIRQHCETVGRPLFVAAIKGYGDPVTQGMDQADCFLGRLGAAGAFMRAFKAAGVSEIVFAGGVRSPGIYTLWPDMTLLKVLLGIGLRLGSDDRILRAVSTMVANHGFRLVAAQDIVPKLIAEKCCYTRLEPTKSDWLDIARGFEVAKALGKLDVGQGCVVQGGYVLGVETVEGTDALIARAGQEARYKKKGCLVKVVKPQQDRRFDMPSIGPKTVAAIAEAGFKGIAIEAGGSLILRLNDVVRAANKAGIFIVGFDREDLPA